MNSDIKRVIISGGGTGGHIFPALSIANEVRRRYPACQILFVGAKGRMEEERIPKAGYPIKLLPVRGLERGGGIWSKVVTLWCLFISFIRAYFILRRFKPEVAVGVGGYASAPTLLVASWLKIPTIVQEQNSFAGKTNRWVGNKATTVCVAYKGMERFFKNAGNIVLTGNPIRKSLTEVSRFSEKAYATLNLDPAKKTLLVLGGSLGARSINESIFGALDLLGSQKYANQIQLLWQCGKYYDAEYSSYTMPKNVRRVPFIQEMDLAYSTADLVISRAGASSISELTLLGLPMILVPSPNVAEDHQTKNAEALVREEAALLIKDEVASQDLIPTALDLLSDASHEKLKALGNNARKLGTPCAAEMIVDEIEKVFI